MPHLVSGTCANFLPVSLPHVHQVHLIVFTVGCSEAHLALCDLCLHWRSGGGVAKELAPPLAHAAVLSQVQRHDQQDEIWSDLGDLMRLGRLEPFRPFRPFRRQHVGVLIFWAKLGELKKEIQFWSIWNWDTFVTVKVCVSKYSHIPWRIHGAGIYANIKGVYWWDPWHTIYSSTVRIRHGYGISVIKPNLDIGCRFFGEAPGTSWQGSL